MNQIFRTILLLWILLSCVLRSDSGVRAQDHYAVFVGVEVYDRSTFSNLEFSGDDAVALSTQFQRLGFKTTVMTSDSQSARLRPTTPKKIIDAIQAVGRSCETEDTLVIGLSGHGVQFSDEELLPSGVRETYFCPGDADLKDKSSLLKISTIVDTMNQTKATKKLLLIDTCQENVLSTEGQKKGGQLIDLGSVHEIRKTVPGGIAILFSCKDKQFSWQHPPLGHSVFSYHVIRYLSGGADARYYDEGKRELAGLVSYVAKNTNDYVIQKNLTPDGQYPVLRGNTTNWMLGNLQDTVKSTTIVLVTPNSYRGVEKLRQVERLREDCQFLLNSNELAKELSDLRYEVTFYERGAERVELRALSTSEIKNRIYSLTQELAEVDSVLNSLRKEKVRAPLKARVPVLGEVLERPLTSETKRTFEQFLLRIAADVPLDDYRMAVILNEHASQFLDTYSSDDFEACVKRLESSKEDSDIATGVVFAAFGGNIEKVRELRKKTNPWTHRHYWVTPFVIRGQIQAVIDEIRSSSRSPDFKEVILEEIELLVRLQLERNGYITDSTDDLLRALKCPAMVTGFMLGDISSASWSYFEILGALDQESALQNHLMSTKSVEDRIYAQLAFARGLLSSVDF